VGTDTAISERLCAVTDVPRLIPRFFRQAVDDASTKVWLLAGDRTWTYAEALQQIERAASWLRAHGIVPGDRVLVTARNSADYLFTWLA
jgi:acyl-CoA synthetase (AMP-forming)/AMP-acid ligase II